MVKLNRLVNRSAGLIVKGSTHPTMPLLKGTRAERDRIASGLTKVEVVDIDTLVPDPDNARVHRERNLEAIKDSLTLYGQVKPLVVRRSTNVVIAGNGTLEAATALGWTKLAVNYVDFDEAQSIGYGLADNRTAELAQWNFEIVARLDRLLVESDHPTVGWTTDELEVLRAADWTPPAIAEGGPGGNGDGEAQAEPLVISFTPDEYSSVGEAIALVRAVYQETDPDLSQADCLSRICSQWLLSQQENT